MHHDADARYGTIPVKDKVEFLTGVYDRMTGLTTNADTKAGVMLTLHSYWAIVFSPNLSKLIIQFPAPPFKMFLWLISFLLTCAFFITFIRSAYESALILLPRIQPQMNHTRKKLSHIFFVDVIKMAGKNIFEKSKSYKEQLNQTGYNEIVDDLVYRINDVANVVNEKNICVKKAIRLSLYTFILWAIALLSLVILKIV